MADDGTATWGFIRVYCLTWISQCRIAHTLLEVDQQSPRGFVTPSDDATLALAFGHHPMSLEIHTREYSPS